MKNKNCVHNNISIVDITKQPLFEFLHEALAIIIFKTIFFIRLHIKTIKNVHKLHTKENPTIKLRKFSIVSTFPNSTLITVTSLEDIHTPFVSTLNINTYNL